MTKREERICGLRTIIEEGRLILPGPSFEFNEIPLVDSVDALHMAFVGGIAKRNLNEEKSK